MTADRLLSAEDVMAILGVKRSFCTVHAAELGGVKVGSRLRFDPAGVQRYIDAQRVTDPAPVEQPKAPRSNVTRPDWLARAIASGEINQVTGRAFGQPAPAARGRRL